MLQKHARMAQGSSPDRTPRSTSAGIQIRPMPGTLRSAGTSTPASSSSSSSTPVQTSSSPSPAAPDARARKARSLRETIAKKVGTFLEAQKDRQQEEQEKHLSEPVLRPLITTAILQREPITTTAFSEEPQEHQPDPAVVDNLTRLIKNAVTCTIHKNNLLSLRTEAAADTLLLMQQMLDDPVAYDIEADRYTIRRLLIKLSREARILPSSLFLIGVKCRVRESVNGGAFADIYRASYHGEPVALKRLRVFRVVVDKDSRVLNAAFLREALVWRQLRHRHILPFFGIDRSSFRPYLCMVSPYMEYGNMLQCIKTLEASKAVAPREIWLYEVAQGLDYLHQEQVVHGDLRGVNILIDEDLHVRLSDFGLSMLLDTKPLSAIPSNNAGQGRWSAPELFKAGSQVSFKSDVWSFACVCIEMYTRLPPYAHLSDMQVHARIMNGDLPKMPSLHTGIPRYILNLLDRCFQIDPSARPPASALVRILSRYRSPLPKTRVAEKPLPPPPTEDDDTPEMEEPSPIESQPDPESPDTATDAQTQSSATSPSPSEPGLEDPSHAQYLTLPPMSPLSLHSFVMIPSTPSTNSQDSHILLPSSPSSGSHESQMIVVSSPSAGSQSSHFVSLMGSSPPSSVSGAPLHLSDASSGYDMVPDSPDPS
ncbi:hypothetical protein EIP91_005396 [Steccherinum ochraceum]|uniref:Protein kinase domain-containing protein n=1 Tax=Steccherinum ochraceum TaxID=92696 RepID=A0A4R0RD86_9APHY|nr:hypothetical protein EIP91_005396 [Steccherinum ochraceum]